LRLPKKHKNNWIEAYKILKIHEADGFFFPQSNNFKVPVPVLQGIGSDGDFPEQIGRVG